VSCRGNALRAASDFSAKEKAEGKDAKAIAADTDAAYASGKPKRASPGITWRSGPAAREPGGGRGSSPYFTVTSGIDPSGGVHSSGHFKGMRQISP